jgi:hypothetical protein
VSSGLKSTVLRTIDLGILVTRPAANLPQTTTANIFTITGGRIMMTSLIGLVTTVLGATATNLKVSSIPTVGTAGDIAANLAVASLEKGALLTLSTTLGGALVGSAASNSFAAIRASSLVIPAGALAVVTSASNTGQIQWDMLYFPIDTGASVTAA